jgi:hypothetical protein
MESQVDRRSMAGRVSIAETPGSKIRFRQKLILSQIAYPSSNAAQKL